MRRQRPCPHTKISLGEPRYNESIPILCWILFFSPIIILGRRPATPGDSDEFMPECSVTRASKQLGDTSQIEIGVLYT